MFSVNTAYMRPLALTRHLHQTHLRRAVLMGRNLSGRPSFPGSLAAKSFIHSHPVSDPNDDILPPITQSKQTGERPLRILSIDGGDSSALSSLFVLQAIIERLEKTQGATKPILPADHFDLIIGNGIGGIMALMFGRLRMSVDEVWNMYLTGTQLQKVFHTGRLYNRWHVIKTLVMEGVPSMYDEANLEKLIKDTIAEHTRDQDPEALLEDSSPCLTAVVTARSADATRPVLMRSYPIPDDADPEKFKIWEAARATSSTPMYFRPTRAGVYEVRYIDGCVSGHSNPSWLAMQEAKTVWPGREIGLFLSLGTGSPTEVALQAPLTRFIENFIYLSANTTRIHDMAWREFDKKYEVSPYVRLSVAHDVWKALFTHHSSLEDMTADTLKYLIETSDNIQRCVDLLTGETSSKLDPSANVQEDEEDAISTETPEDRERS